MPTNNNNLRRFGAAGDARRDVAARQRGAIIIVMLIALLLLAAMVFYVFNLGHQTHRRTLTQTSADNSAMATAGWVARSMNTVAMNNVATTRYLAAVNFIDSMPMAVEHTLADEDTLLDVIVAQLGRGSGDSYSRQGLLIARDGVQAEIDILEPMERLFVEQVDVRELTMYEGPRGRGELWRAMEAMDLLSQAEMQTTAVLAEVASRRAARANHEDLSVYSPGLDGEEVGQRLAVDDAMIPWVRGSFDDFLRPVLYGMLPEHVDHEIYNRGPWDTLLGMRTVPRSASTAYVPGTDRGNVPIGSPSTGRSVGRIPDPTHYATYGPHVRMIRQANNFTHNHLPYSRFAQGARWRSGSSLVWLNTLAGAKLRYGWHGEDVILIHVPEWETSFPRSVIMAELQPSPIRYTRFIAIELKSRFPRTSPQFGSPGSIASRHFPGRDPVQPRVHYANGWHDPRDWNVPKIDDYIWRDEWQSATDEDPSIGIALTFDHDGQPIFQPVFNVDYFIFAGVDHGQVQVPIRNPYNFTSTDDLPAPIDLDYERLPETHTPRPQPFRYFTYSKRTESTPLWAKQFSGAVNNRKPFPGPVAIAQANVFNNHSWDLWTQMWHAQLVPVDDYSYWINRLDQVGAEPVIVNHLRTLEPLATDMLQH